MFASGTLHADDAARTELVEHRATWDALHIADYSFVLWINGAWTRTSAIRIVVRKGEVQSARYVELVPNGATTGPGAALGFREGPAAEPRWRLTIPALFQHAADSLASPGTETHLKFDSRFGFPTEIATRRLHMSDSEFAFWASNFTILE
jgi:hypothetical protein